MFVKRKLRNAFLFFVVAVALIGCFALTACSEQDNTDIAQNGAGSSNQNVPSTEKDDNGMKHYEIDLSMQNFDDFFEYNYTDSFVGVSPEYPNSKGDSYLVSGVLSYAYYQNVVVTFRMKDNNTNKYVDFTVKLNAAGDGGFYEADQIYKDAKSSIGGSSSFTVTIQNVTGKVVFYM